MPDAQILVVEDEYIIAKDIENTLTNLGYSVPAIASSGKEAIQKVSKFQPDLILMDIVLKGSMDGVETADQIRSKFDIPVVYLTAYADDATLQRAKITEPYGYLIKPFQERELYSTIEMALYKQAMEKAIKEKERWLATTLSSLGEAVIATDEKGIITYWWGVNFILH
jgi:CheY-like chemotaxis protein